MTTTAASWTALVDVLFEDPLVGRCLVAPDGTILRANAEWFRSTGFSQEVVGEDLVALFPETRDMALALHARARAGHRVEVPRHAQRVNGVETWWEGSIAPVPMEGGAGLLVTARRVDPPITRQRTGARLLQDVIDGAPSIIFLKDLEGRFVTVNKQLETLLGTTREQLRGKSDLDLFPVERAEYYRAHDRQVLDHARPICVEEVADLADGRRHVFLANKFPVHDEEGRVYGVCGISHDITELKAAEQALRDAHERLRIHVETTPLGLVEWDSEYRVVGFSRRAEQILGWSAEEVTGKRIDEIPWVPEEDWPSVRAAMRDMASGDRATTVNANRNLRRDGSSVYCEWYSSSVHDAAGRLVSVMSLVLDVTERRRAAETAERGEAVLAQAGTMAHLGAWWLDVADPSDMDASPLRWSDEVFRIFGYAPGEVPVSNELFFRHVHPDDRERVQDAMRRALATRARYAVEHRILRRDGQERIVLEQAGGQFDGRGRLVRIVGAIQDVTDRRRAAQALRQSEERLRALADSIPHLAWTADPDGALRWYNRRWYEYTGTTPQEMEGWGWQAVHDPAVLPTVLARWRECIAKGEDFEMEFPLRGADGTFRRFLTRGYPLKDERGVVLQWFGTNTDVTDLVEAQEALRAADRRKDEFLGMLSHELRNPLAPIRNASYVLRRSAPGSDQARRAQAVIERQAEHLTRLVDDLLDVTRIARGKIDLRCTRVDLREVVSRGAEDFRVLMHDRGVDFRVVLPDEQLWADADATRVTQIVGNLLHNASKFTRRGDTVTVSVERTGGDAAIRVSDTGAGIDAALLPQIFEPFVQGERTLARTEGGLGLGLALVKGIAELHRGSVCARSAGKGRGAEFVVTLPLAPAARARDELATASARGGRTRRVLVVDDNTDAAESLGQLLELAGHRVEVAFDGPSALAKARASPPDVVLCDLGLPGMNGYELARALRAAVPGLLLYAVSGYAQPEDVKRAAEAGFDGHIAKPADPEALERLLS